MNWPNRLQSHGIFWHNSIVIDVSVGAGSIHGTVWEYRRQIESRQKYFLELILADILHFDTAQSYYAGAAEAALGEVLKKFPSKRNTFKVDTKIGGVYSRLPQPFNHVTTNSRVIQKMQILSRRQIDDFDARLKPKHVIPALKTSLRRLGLDTVDCYYLHGLPRKSIIDDFANELFEAKKLGLCVAIGVSLDRKYEFDFTWCDRIQVPLSLISQFQKFTGELVINRIFSDKSVTAENAIKLMMRNQRVTRCILGSRNIERILNFQKLIVRSTQKERQ